MPRRDASVPDQCRSSEKRTLARVLYYDSCTSIERAALALLENEGFELVDCGNSQVLLETVVQRHPSVVLFGFRSRSAEDLGVLQLVRRVSPDVPLILLADDGSLDTQRFVQSIRPIYYAVSPVDATELLDAVRAALARPRANQEPLRKIS